MSSKFFRHWPTLLIGLLVAAVFIVAIFTFQVKSSEVAVITAFGRVTENDPEPGLHFRWPYPFEQVYKFDNRDRCFDGLGGRLDELSTADTQTVVAGIFVIYRISNAKEFFNTFKTVENAERELNTWMRTAKKNVFSQYKLSELINPQGGLKLTEIAEQIRTELQNNVASNGITIKLAGINSLQLPPGVTSKVFERMMQERTAAAARYMADGRSQAEQIMVKAQSERMQLLSDAQAQAKVIKAEGDAEAAQYYQVFSKDPELASFLRSLDSLSVIMQNRTTLIFDTNTVPFNLLKPDALNLKSLSTTTSQP